MGSEIEAVTGGDDKSLSLHKGKGISKETSSTRFSQQSSLALTGSRGQGPFTKTWSLSSAGWPIVGDALTGRRVSSSVLFWCYSSKGMLDSRMSVTFQSTRSLAYAELLPHTNEFLQDSNSLFARAIWKGTRRRGLFFHRMILRIGAIISFA